MAPVGDYEVRVDCSESALFGGLGGLAFGAFRLQGYRNMRYEAPFQGTWITLEKVVALNPKP